jgi:2-amino-4-hydroxy-6-hydroxymethyldihydropteridine diphosphokinase
VDTDDPIYTWRGASDGPEPFSAAGAVASWTPLHFEDWEPRYLAVTRDLGYSTEGDLEAAQRLAKLAFLRAGTVVGDEALAPLLSKQPVFVCAAGPTLEEELAERRLDGTVIAADGATARLLKRGTLPEIIVTDLDGDMQAILSASRKGSIVVAHAHADNIPQLEEYIPQIAGPLVPSVQCQPPAGTHNYGGLTDGDRAVYLADHFGASRIVLSGFDFGDPVAHPLSLKRQRKFIWGAMLIASLDNPAVMFLNEYEASYDASKMGGGEFGSPPSRP